MSDTPIDESAKGSDINLSDIISRLTQGSSEQNTVPQNTVQKASDSGDILSSLMSNPELIAKIPQLISFVTPLLSGFLGSHTETQKEGEIPAVSSVVSAQKSPPKPMSHSDSRAALLCAIKPYLCADRQAAVDYIIKLSRLGEILKTL